MKTMRDRIELVANYFRDRRSADFFMYIGSLFAALFQGKAK